MRRPLARQEKRRTAPDRRIPSRGEESKPKPLLLEFIPIKLHKGANFGDLILCHPATVIDNPDAVAVLIDGAYNGNLAAGRREFEGILYEVVDRLKDPEPQAENGVGFQL